MPLDRDLIGAPAHALDDVVDAVEEVGRRLWLYNVAEPTDAARQFGRLIRAQADTLAAAVPLLASDRGDADVLRAAVELHRLENEGDGLFDRALADVYAEARDVPTFIAATRWRDLYGLFEAAPDRG